VLRLQAGEPEAFDELYGLYLAPLYGYMVVALHDHHEAQDATHEVFLKMLVALPRYELRGVPFRVWLFRIARNHLLDRKARLRRTELGGSAEVLQLVDERRDTGLEVPLRALSDDEFLELIKRLPLTQRQVLVLRYIFDMSFDEIGLALHVTPSYARNLQRRAFLKLRPSLTAEREDEAAGRVSRLAMRLLTAPRTVITARLRALY